MNRCKFFTIETHNDIQENDYLHNSLSLFKPRYATALYRVESIDVQRPDLISFKVYSTVRYWWLVCSFNKIANPLTDIEIGDLLELPHMLDIQDFYKRYTVR